MGRYTDMRMATHIKIAKAVKIKTEEHTKLRINNIAYLLGSIAPDVTHRLMRHNVDTSITKFVVWLQKLENRKDGLARSFLLGTIMHYSCDYFCLAHNEKNTFLNHCKYEKFLGKYVRKHFKSFTEIPEEIAEELRKFKDIAEKIGIEAMINSEMNKSIGKADIYERVMEMHDTYREQAAKVKNMNELIELDTTYAVGVCSMIMCAIT